MRHASIAAIALAAAAALALAATATTSTAPAPVATPPRAAAPGSAPAESYKLLGSRNMFLKDRTPRPTYTRSSYSGYRSYSTPTVQAPSLVLTGVAQYPGGCVAFFEDTRSGKTTRATAGQTVAGCRIVAATLDGVEYEFDGRRGKVLVGQDLSARAATFASAAPAASSPTSVPASGPATATATAPATAASQPADQPPAADAAEPADTSNDSEDPVIRRLRQRRAEQTRQ